MCNNFNPEAAPEQEAAAEEERAAEEAQETEEEEEEQEEQAGEPMLKRTKLAAEPAPPATGELPAAAGGGDTQLGALEAAKVVAEATEDCLEARRLKNEIDAPWTGGSEAAGGPRATALPQPSPSGPAAAVRASLPFSPLFNPPAAAAQPRFSPALSPAKLHADTVKPHGSEAFLDLGSNKAGESQFELAGLAGPGVQAAATVAEGAV
jgi:hypothetical protein